MALNEGLIGHTTGGPRRGFIGPASTGGSNRADQPFGLSLLTSPSGRSAHSPPRASLSRIARTKPRCGEACPWPASTHLGQRIKRAWRRRFLLALVLLGSWSYIGHVSSPPRGQRSFGYRDQVFESVRPQHTPLSKRRGAACRAPAFLQVFVAAAGDDQAAAAFSSGDVRDRRALRLP